MGTIADGFAAYFARFRDQSHVVTYSPDLDTSLFCDSSDVAGLVRWRPVFGAPAQEWVSISTSLTPLVREYYSTAWFQYVGGNFRDYQIMLDPIAPRYFPTIERQIVRFWTEREDDHDWVPIGIEARSGDRVLIANVPNGNAIALEDVHNGNILPIASNPVELLKDLVPY